MRVCVYICKMSIAIPEILQASIYLSAQKALKNDFLSMIVHVLR